MTLEEKLNSLIKLVEKQQTEIETLKSEIDIIKDVKKEIYYQKFLEKYFQSSHKVTKYGVTDISTETHHIEIKSWKCYKQALGQLQSYNYGDKKKLIVALFNDYIDKEKVIELFHSYNIDVWDLIKTPQGIDIKKHDKQTNTFYNWLIENVEHHKGSILALNQVCEKFLGKTVSSKIATRYKREIERFITERFPTVDSQYKQHWGVVRSRGWRDLCIKT
jgi:hypothetical protein